MSATDTNPSAGGSGAVRALHAQSPIHFPLAGKVAGRLEHILGLERRFDMVEIKARVVIRRALAQHGTSGGRVLITLYMKDAELEAFDQTSRDEKTVRHWEVTDQ